MRALALSMVVFSSAACGPYAYDSGKYRQPESTNEPFVACSGDVVGGGTADGCYVSRWDDVLQLYVPGFDDAYGLRVNVDTRRVRAGETVRLGDAAQAWSDLCDYDGVLEFKSDEPRWALSVVGSCVDQPERGGVMGRWSGRTR
jgi:hypothetical protein